MEEKNKILINTDPNIGPLDGVHLKTDCVRAKLTRHVQKSGYNFKHEIIEASIAASVNTGMFAIRDLETNIMVVIKLESVLNVCTEAINVHGRLNECQTMENVKAAEKESSG